MRLDRYESGVKRDWTLNNMELGYFAFLCQLVDIDPDRFARSLHTKEFNWSIKADETRALAGKELRQKYILDGGEVENISGPCSVLEMLVALVLDITKSKEKRFVCRTPEKWFEQLIKNLNLIHYPDDDHNILTKATKNDHLLNMFLERIYSKLGKGGLFPIHGDYYDDQRKVSIWEQMLLYAEEEQTMLIERSR